MRLLGITRPASWGCSWAVYRREHSSQTRIGRIEESDSLPARHSVGLVHVEGPGGSFVGTVQPDSVEHHPVGGNFLRLHPMASPLAGGRQAKRTKGMPSGLSRSACYRARLRSPSVIIGRAGVSSRPPSSSCSSCHLLLSRALHRFSDKNINWWGWCNSDNMIDSKKAPFDPGADRTVSPRRPPRRSTDFMTDQSRGCRHCELTGLESRVNVAGWGIGGLALHSSTRAHAPLGEQRQDRPLRPRQVQRARTARSPAEAVVVVGIVAANAAIIYGGMVRKSEEKSMPTLREGADRRMAMLDEIDDGITGRNRGPGRAATPAGSVTPTDPTPVTEPEPVPNGPGAPGGDAGPREQIRRRRDAEPFAPFIVVTADGKEHRISHPGLVMIGTEELAVGVTVREDGVFDKLVVLKWDDVREVRRAEQPGSTTGGKTPQPPEMKPGKVPAVTVED